MTPATASTTPMPSIIQGVLAGWAVARSLIASIGGAGSGTGGIGTGVDDHPRPPRVQRQGRHRPTRVGQATRLVERTEKTMQAMIRMMWGRGRARLGR